MAAYAVASLLRSKGSTTRQSAPTRTGAAAARRWPAWIGLAIRLALVILISIAAIMLYQSYASVLTPPIPPEHESHAFLFFDEPNVSAQLDVTVAEPGSFPVEYSYILSIPRPNGVEGATFHLLLTGGAQFSDAEPLSRQRGCPGFPDLAVHFTEVSCVAGELSDRGPGLGIGPEGEAQVISGRINGKVQIVVNSRKPISQQGGARTYFNLPTFGTTNLPEEERDTLQLELPALDLPVHVPGSLITRVTYTRELNVSERIDYVAPELVTSGELTWVTATRSAIHPSGQIVDTSKEIDAQRRLFILGVLLGVLGGFLPSLVEGIGRAFTKA